MKKTSGLYLVILCFFMLILYPSDGAFSAVGKFGINAEIYGRIGVRSGDYIVLCPGGYYYNVADHGFPHGGTSLVEWGTWKKHIEGEIILEYFSRNNPNNKNIIQSFKVFFYKNLEFIIWGDGADYVRKLGPGSSKKNAELHIDQFIDVINKSNKEREVVEKILDEFHPFIYLSEYMFKEYHDTGISLKDHCWFNNPPFSKPKTNENLGM